MQKICPLYKQACIKFFGSELLLFLDNDIFRDKFAEFIKCDRNDCVLWVASDVDPDKYGYCGLRK